MMLLGQVDQPKIQGERANDGPSLFGRERSDGGLEIARCLPTLVARSPASQDGKLANLLFAGKKLFSFEIDENFSEEPAEPTDILPQRAIDFNASF